jgi:hypothetical protein
MRERQALARRHAAAIDAPVEGIAQSLVGLGRGEVEAMAIALRFDLFA